MTTAEAAARLGVKTQTLYAYVSRGLLRSSAVPGRRASRFERSQVEQLAGRGERTMAPATQLEVLVDSELTLLDPAGALFFRGWDATQACKHASYEAVAEWLWTARRYEPPTWQADPAALDAASRVLPALGPYASLVDRMRVAATVVGTTDPLRNDRRDEAVIATARSLISTMVDALPMVGPKPRWTLHLAEGSRQASIAARLWARLCARAPRPAELTALNAALVLLADHEMAASTLGARVAASTWADLYLVLQTGLGVLSGPLHGGAGESLRTMLNDITSGSPAAEVIGKRLREEPRLAGFGHPLYRSADPRAAMLLAMVEAAEPPGRRWRAVTDVLSVVEGRGMPAANIDFALAALAHSTDMVAGATEVIFATARSAGWTAHALEEYPHRLRFRPRASYNGPPPSSQDPHISLA